MPAGAVPRRPGALLFVLTAAVGIGPLFNYGISVSSALIIRDLGISVAQFGLVASVAFGGAAVSSLGLGRLIDKTGARAQLSFIFVGTLAGLLVAGFASNFWALVVGAVLAGLAQGISVPSTNRIVREVVPHRKRPGWVGIKQSGVQAAQLFAGLYFPTMALWAGWTGAAVGAALIALALLAYSISVVPAEGPPRRALTVSSPSPSSMPMAAKTQPQKAAERGSTFSLSVVVAVLGAIGFFSGLGMQATNAYLPLYVVEELGFSLVLAGVVAGVCGVVGVVSRIWYAQQMASGARVTTLLVMIAAGGILSALAFGAASPGEWPVLIWLGALVYGATILGINVVINAGLIEVVPATRLGAASSVNAMGMYMGFALGPLIMGMLRQATGSFVAGWALIGFVYVLCLAAALLLRWYWSRGSHQATA